MEPKGRTVLIVEDNKAVKNVVAMLLGRAGWKTFETDSGTEAMELFNSVIPDVVLCDLRMPNLTGIELIRMLRQNPLTQRIPIVVMSAHVEKVGPELAGCFILSKPFGFSELLATMEEALRTRAP